MCVKVSGEGKWWGKEEGGREGQRQVPTDPTALVLESELERCLQACADLEGREDGLSSLGRREGLRLAAQRLQFLGPHHASYSQDVRVGTGLWLSCPGTALLLEFQEENPQAPKERYFFPIL